MKLFLLLSILNFSKVPASNTLTKVYLFPGQGSDERIFEKIKLDSNFKICYIIYPLPKKRTTMAEYAHLISEQIDTTKKYIFIGVSLGGMICTELADFMKPEKIIIISSAKCKKELPLRYRFQKTIPLNKIIPKKLIKKGAQILQPIVEPDRNKRKEIFKSMLQNKSPEFYKRTVDLIINWDRKTYSNIIVHIHGTNDHTIPIRNVKFDYEINGGSHMMTLTRGDEISSLLNTIILKN
jgi:pimeloyl-ACP methyl ester carboxylesterase